MGLGLFFVLSPQFNQGTTGEGPLAGKGETGWLGFRAGSASFSIKRRRRRNGTGEATFGEPSSENK